MNDEKKLRGFSGLTELISDISDIEGVLSVELNTQLLSPSVPKQKQTTSNASSDPLDAIINMGSARKKTIGVGWKWVFGISAGILAICFFNYMDNSTSQSSYNSSTTTSRSDSSRSSYGTLYREIQNGKARANQMEAQINDMDSRLNDYSRQMKTYESLGMVDQYNNLVQPYNSLLYQRNELYEEYSNLIDEINAKIARYNSGER